MLQGFVENLFDVAETLNLRVRHVRAPPGRSLNPALCDGETPAKKHKRESETTFDGTLRNIQKSRDFLHGAAQEVMQFDDPRLFGIQFAQLVERSRQVERFRRACSHPGQ